MTQLINSASSGSSSASDTATNSGYRVFDSRTTLEECDAIPSTIDSIILLGYLTSGDCPPASYRRYVSPSGPGVAPSYTGVIMVGGSGNQPHIYDKAGNVWLLDEEVIDPRWLGAKADYLNFSQQVINAGTSGQLGFSYNYYPTTLDVGKYFGATMSGPPSPSWRYIRFVGAPSNGDAFVFGQAVWTSQTSTGNGSFVNAYPGCSVSTVTVTSIAANGTYLTITTAAHGLAIGDTVNITVAGGSPSTYSGTYIGTVISGTVIQAPSNLNAGGSTGGTAFLTQFIPGAYTFTFTTSTAYSVTDPNGFSVGTGSFASASPGVQSQFTSGKISALLQQGTTGFVGGDVIVISLTGGCAIFTTGVAGTSANQVAISSAQNTMASNLVNWVNSNLSSYLIASITDTSYNEMLFYTVATGGATQTWTAQYSGPLTTVPLTDKYFRGGCWQGDLLAQVTGYTAGNLTLNTTTTGQVGVNSTPQLIISGTYVSGTGIITLNLTKPAAMQVGNSGFLSNLVGSGVGYLEGSGKYWPLLTVSGNTVTLQGPVGMGVITITGGNITPYIFSGSVYTIGNLLYVTACVGTVQCGLGMFGTGGAPISGYSFIHRQVGGTPGGIGTYVTSVTQTVGTQTSPVSTALQNGFAQCSMGSDNYAPIQNAMNLASSNQPSQLTNAIPGQTTDYIQANVRAQKVVIRPYNGDGGAFGVLQPLLINESIDMEWEGTGEICALPGFAGQAASYKLSSLTWSNGLTTATLASALPVSSGSVNIYLSATSPSAYDGYQTCNILNSTTLTFTLSAYTLTLTSITSSSGTATATISGFIPVVVGNTATAYLTGNTPPDYNGTFTITCTSENTFTFPVAGGPPDASVLGTVAIEPTAVTTLGTIATLDNPSPNFGGRWAVMMSPLSAVAGNYTGVAPTRGSLTNARISTYYGWGQRCLWFPTFLYFELRGRSYFVYNRRGLLLGYKGGQLNNNTLYANEISGTTCYYILSKVDTENRGVHIDLGVTDCIIQKILMFHIMVPYEDSGNASNQLREIHCFPGDNLGCYLLGNQYSCGRIYTDSFGVLYAGTLGFDPPNAYCVVAKNPGYIDEITFAQNSLANAGTLNAPICSIFYVNAPTYPIQVNKLHTPQGSWTMSQILMGPGANQKTVSVEIKSPLSYAIGGFYTFFGTTEGVLFDIMSSPQALGAGTLNPGANGYITTNGTWTLPPYPAYGQKVRISVLATSLSTVKFVSSDGSLVSGVAGGTGVTLPTGIARYEFEFLGSSGWRYFAYPGT